MKKQLIVTVPNPKLKTATKKVTIFDETLKSQARFMEKILRDNSDYGIGLASNQLGFDNQLFVAEYIDDEGKETIPLTYFVNPKIVNKSDDIEVIDEGCLSVPSIFLPIERSKKIKVKAQNLDGKMFKLTAKGLFARLILHETEHLEGKLFTEKYREKLISKFPQLKSLKMLYIGSGEFSEIILRGLILMGLNIPLVITEDGKNQTCVAKTCELFNKKYIQTSNINNTINIISELKPDLIILADFGQIIPGKILQLPKIASINIHPSLLPKYRGSTPIQTAILSGEKETGVSIIKMSEKIDEGKVIFQKSLEINELDNGESLKIRLANLGLKSVLDVLPKIQKGEIEEKNQDNSKATLTRKLTKADGEINWQKKLIEIERQIRAFYPWPGSYTFIDGKRLIIHQAHIEDGKLFIDIVQPEGGKIMNFGDFLNGFRGEKPKWFEKIKLVKTLKIR